MPANTPETSPYAILTYQRSGTHYIQNLLAVRFGIRTHRYHEIEQISNKDRFIFSVVRSPIECIASDIARFDSLKLSGSDAKHYDTSHYGDEQVWNESFSVSMDNIDKFANIVIDFNQLINDPDLVANKIAKETGLRLFDNGISLDVQPEREGSMFIVTSKSVPSYEKIYDHVLSLDLSIAMEAYERVLAKAI